MPRTETVLARLIRQRHLAREEVVRDFAQVAAELGSSVTLSVTQLDRLRFGELLSLPRPATVRVLESQFATSIHHLLAPASLAADGWGAGAERPGPGADGGDPTNRRDALKALGIGAGAATGAGAMSWATLDPHDAAAEAMELTRRAERSDLGPTTLEHLDLAVRQFETAYAAAPSAQLFGQARWYRQRVADLLDGRHTLRETRQLFTSAGWLSIVLAWLALDLGQVRTAEAYCLDAWQHGYEAEHPQLCGFAMDACVTIALDDSRPRAALRAAHRGQAVAPAGSVANVRLVAKQARAHARLGDAERFDSTLRQAEQHLARVSKPGSALFNVDTISLELYAASANIWLRRPTQADTHARHALQLYDVAPVGSHAPSRRAIACLDLGIASALLGQVDEACAAGTAALGSDRFASSVYFRTRAGELDTLLSRRFPTAPEVIEYHQRYHAFGPLTSPSDSG